MREIDRFWHIFRKSVARSISKHHSLISRTLFMIFSSINTLCNVRRLFVEIRFNNNIVRIESLTGTSISDFSNNFPNNVFNIDISFGRDFARNNNSVGCAHCFACDPTFFVLSETRIKNCIRNLIAHFVGMSFRNGLGSKNLRVLHSFAFLLLLIAEATFVK